MFRLHLQQNQSVFIVSECYDTFAFCYYSCLVSGAGKTCPVVLMISVNGCLLLPYWQNLSSMPVLLNKQFLRRLFVLVDLPVQFCVRVNSDICYCYFVGKFLSLNVKDQLICARIFRIQSQSKNAWR